MIKSGSFTIATITSSLDSFYHLSIFMGITKKAKELGCNIIGFPGGPLASPDSICNVRNKLYDIMNPKLLDGLIILSSSIGRFVGKKEFTSFLKRFGDLPMVSIGENLVDIPVVKPDYKNGIKLILGHLTEVHRCRKIAVIRGVENNTSSTERFHFFLKEMSKRNLKVSDDLIIYSDQNLFRGGRAVKTLLDERKTDFDAILCFSDVLAIEAIGELRTRGIRVPEDIIVAGFQGSPAALFEESGLTTVDENSYTLGQKSLEVLIKLIKKTNTPKKTVLPTQLVIRNSCGCPHEKQIMINRVMENNSYLESLFSGKENILDYKGLAQTLKRIIKPLKALKKAGTDGFISWLEQIADNFTNELLIFQNSLIRENNIFFRKLGGTLISEYNFPTLLNLLSSGLKIKYCYIVLYNKKTSQSEYSTILNAFNDGKLVNQEKPLVFPTKQLLPEALFHPSLPFQMVIEPLFYESTQLGYLAIDASEHLGFIFEAIQSIISSTIANQTQLHEIKEVERSISDLNKNLEERVNRRTHELHKSITVITDTQKQLEETEKIAMLGNLSASISHDVRTPIGVGITAISYLQVKNAELEAAWEQEKLPEHLNELKTTNKLIVKNLKHARDLLQNLEQLAKDQLYNKQRTIDVIEYIHQIIECMNPKLKKCNVSSQVTGIPHLKLKTFPGLIYQVFTNLIMNSIFHGFENKKSGTITVHVETTDKTIAIVYADNGCGIEENIIKKVFNPFFTTKAGKGGTGLGLHIVYSLVVNRLKGNIRCKSIVNAGTTFYLDIPMPMREEK